MIIGEGDLILKTPCKPAMKTMSNVQITNALKQPDHQFLIMGVSNYSS